MSTEDKGQRIECKVCDTVWWSGKAGLKCPTCDPLFKRLASTIRFNLETKRTEKLQLLSKIDALEDLDAMVGRLKRGL